MEEKILNTRKNGMAMLLLTLLGYVVAIALFIYSITLLNADRMLLGVPLLILSIAYWIAGIFLFCGLKVLKPQEALVLTLFGDYIGTLKGQGFYWVNPFCTAVNPAAGTRLSQSGDVNSKENSVAALFGNNGQNAQMSVESMSKKISLKMMTLNNSRQKINDCLGNPVEIGIAVIWRVTDTAKAVFNVDKKAATMPLPRQRAAAMCPHPTPPPPPRPATDACGGRLSLYSLSPVQALREPSPMAKRKSTPQNNVLKKPRQKSRLFRADRLLDSRLQTLYNWIYLLKERNV